MENEGVGVECALVVGGWWLVSVLGTYSHATAGSGYSLPVVEAPLSVDPESGAGPLVPDPRLFPQPPAASFRD